MLRPLNLSIQNRAWVSATTAVPLTTTICTFKTSLGRRPELLNTGEVVFGHKVLSQKEKRLGVLLRVPHGSIHRLLVRLAASPVTFAWRRFSSNLARSMIPAVCAAS